MRQLLHVRGLMILATLLLSASSVCAIQHYHDEIGPTYSDLGHNAPRTNQQVEVGRNSVRPVIGITTVADTTRREGTVRLSSSNFTKENNLTISPPAKTLRYFRLNSPSVDLCQSACAADAGCVAYTYVRPGGYRAGDPPMCYLMSSLGPKVANACCVTGVKGSNRGGPTGSARVFDITGTWEDTGNYGSSRWRFTALGGNRYHAQQTGFGNATGTAVVTGTRLRIDWTCCGGAYAGYADYNLDPTRGTSGKGIGVVTKGNPGTHESSIRKIQN